MKCKILIVSIVFATSLSSCYDRDKKVDKSSLVGMDYRTFQDTPAWELAKAVDDENTAEIIRQIKECKVPVDYRETRFGHTLLMMAVMNDDTKSVKSLLALGADPNAYDADNEETPVILASGAMTDDIEILKLLLNHGGNPNSENHHQVNKNIEDFHSFALLEAAERGIERVKLLVEHGANVNKADSIYLHTALENTLYQDHLDATLYLLEHGANYNMKIYHRGIDGLQYIDIIYMLRLAEYPLDSKEYQDKMKVVAFLKQKGLDYRNSPIPDRVYGEVKHMYPDTWREYIKRY